MGINLLQTWWQFSLPATGCFQLLSHQLTAMIWCRTKNSLEQLSFTLASQSGTVLLLSMDMTHSVFSRRGSFPPKQQHLCGLGKQHLAFPGRHPVSSVASSQATKLLVREESGKRHRKSNLEMILPSLPDHHGLCRFRENILLGFYGFCSYTPAEFNFSDCKASRARIQDVCADECLKLPSAHRTPSSIMKFNLPLQKGFSKYAK